MWGPSPGARDRAAAKHMTMRLWREDCFDTPATCSCSLVFPAACAWLYALARKGPHFPSFLSGKVLCSRRWCCCRCSWSNTCSDAVAPAGRGGHRCSRRPSKHYSVATSTTETSPPPLTLQHGVSRIRSPGSHAPQKSLVNGERLSCITQRLQHCASPSGDFEAGKVGLAGAGPRCSPSA